jgi:hypothetical protein
MLLVGSLYGLLLLSACFFFLCCKRHAPKKMGIFFLTHRGSFSAFAFSFVSSGRVSMLMLLLSLVGIDVM